MNLLNEMDKIFSREGLQATPCFLGFLKKNDDLHLRNPHEIEELRYILFGVQPGTWTPHPRTNYSVRNMEKRSFKR